MSLVLVIGLLLWSIAVWAADDLGQHCFGFDEHSDTIRVWAVASEDDPLAGILGIDWRSNAPEAPYQMLGTGMLAEAIPEDTHPFVIGFSVTHGTPAFNGSRNCVFRVKLSSLSSLPGLTGKPWEVECTGGPGNFSLQSTLTYEACPAAVQGGHVAQAARAHLPPVGYDPKGYE